MKNNVGNLFRKKMVLRIFRRTKWSSNRRMRTRIRENKQHDRINNNNSGRSNTNNQIGKSVRNRWNNYRKIPTKYMSEDDNEKREKNIKRLWNRNGLEDCGKDGFLQVRSHSDLNCFQTVRNCTSSNIAQ